MLSSSWCFPWKAKDKSAAFPWQTPQSFWQPCHYSSEKWKKLNYCTNLEIKYFCNIQEHYKFHKITCDVCKYILRVLFVVSVPNFVSIIRKDVCVRCSMPNNINENFLKYVRSNTCKACKAIKKIFWICLYDIVQGHWSGSYTFAGLKPSTIVIFCCLEPGFEADPILRNGDPRARNASSDNCCFLITLMYSQETKMG